MANWAASRRSFLHRLGLYGAAAPAMSALATLGSSAKTLRLRTPPTTHPRQIGNREISGATTMPPSKGDIKLYMFRKRLGAPQAGQPALPVLFLVHGSSISSRPSFDLRFRALASIRSWMCLRVTVSTSGPWISRATEDRPRPPAIPTLPTGSRI